MSDRNRVNMKDPAQYMPILRLYVAAATPILRHHFRRDCCVNATRVAMMVLELRGIDLVPTPVEIVVANKIYTDLVKKGEVPTEDWEAMGAHSLGIDTEASIPGQWAGHLVGVHEEVILDSATGQFRRLDKGIAIDDMTLVIFEGQRWPVEGHNEEGASMFYRPLEPSVDFRELPGFQEHEGNFRVAGEILSMMTVIAREMTSTVSQDKAEEKRDRKRRANLRLVK